MHDLVQRLLLYRILPRYIDACIWVFRIFAFMQWLKYCEICTWKQVTYFSPVHKLIAWIFSVRLSQYLLVSVEII